MKITVDQAALADAAQWCSRALAARPAVPVLAGIRLDAAGPELTLSAFDYDTSATAVVTIAPGEDGSVLLPGRLLAEITRSLPGRPVTLESDGARVAVTCGPARFALACLPLEEYPSLPDMPEPAGTIGSAALAGAVARVAVAAASDDTLPVLTAVLVELPGDGAPMTLAATDRYRLAVAEAAGWARTDGGVNDVVLVPARALMAAARAMAAGDVVTVSVGDGLAGFAGAGMSMVCRQIAGEFPSFRKLMPSSFAAYGVTDRAGLAEAARRAALVTAPKAPVRLTFSPGMVSLDAGSDGESSAAEALDAEWTGDGEVTVGFQPEYLLDGLAGMGDGPVSMGVNDPGKAVLLTGDGAPGFRYLMMPVRAAA